MAIKQAIQQIECPAQPINFNWSDDSAVKNLLDVISSILAEEYVEIAKRNHDVFKNEK